MRRALAIMAIAAAALLAGFAGTVWWEVRRPPAQRRGEAARVTVQRGEPFSLLAGRLERAGLVRRARPLVVYATLTGGDRAVQSGTYAFTIGERPVDILRRLAAGDVLRALVTIPEGWTKWEIAGAFGAAAVDSAALLEAIHDPGLRERRRVEAESLEGYLFPDSYLVPWGATPLDVVRQMLSRLDEVFDAELVTRAAEVGMTPHEVLTLASIVEAEASIGEERARVAAVYLNRLRRGMRLEADPTVAYAMGGYRGRLLFEDLALESPYNTYRRGGLPPGPICSPGEAAIRAVLYPDSTSRDLYFVARGDGGHVFSETLREHNDAVRRLRALQREARRSGGGDARR
ncbi:MAG: endolytic transglycosylase MltG [Candidatus Krumholzibacteria bacterium]|nr:endolytic transglycosylase MltG [Candidatus Krumholzibacteria bacterium]